MNGAARETVRVVARSRPTEGACDSIALGQEGKTITVRQVTPLYHHITNSEVLRYVNKRILRTCPQESSVK